MYRVIINDYPIAVGIENAQILNVPPIYRWGIVYAHARNRDLQLNKIAEMLYTKLFLIFFLLINKTVTVLLVF
jgi:hypothetical protein